MSEHYRTFSVIFSFLLRTNGKKTEFLLHRRQNAGHQYGGAPAIMEPDKCSELSFSTYLSCYDMSSKYFKKECDTDYNNTLKQFGRAIDDLS